MTYYSSIMNKSGKCESKNVGFVGCCLRCPAIPVILDSLSDICVVDIHSPKYRTVPMSVLHAVIEFSISGTLSLLDIHQIATVVYENDCKMSGLFSIGLCTPAVEPDAFNSNCQDLPKSYR